MALQATQSLPTASPLLSSPTTGLRRPSDRFALKSAFFSPSVNLLFPQQAPVSAAAAGAPKFSMRVASKQAYICRDCGYIYNDRTPFEKVPDSYFCPGICVCVCVLFSSSIHESNLVVFSIFIPISVYVQSLC
ncbi:hypothetical protein ACSBR2_042447 [Camellia fascicularis]